MVPPRQISIGDKIEDFMSLGSFQISGNCESERVALQNIREITFEYFYTHLENGISYKEKLLFSS